MEPGDRAAYATPPALPTKTKLSATKWAPVIVIPLGGSPSFVVHTILPVTALTATVVSSSVLKNSLPPE